MAISITSDVSWSIDSDDYLNYCRKNRLFTSGHSGTDVYIYVLRYLTLKNQLIFHFHSPCTCLKIDSDLLKKLRYS